MKIRQVICRTNKTTNASSLMLTLLNLSFKMPPTVPLLKIFFSDKKIFLFVVNMVAIN